MTILQPRFRADGETGLLQRLLDVHVVVGNVGDELRVSQRLVGSAHDAETDVLIPTFHESWNDCVIGALARS